MTETSWELLVVLHLNFSQQFYEALEIIFKHYTVRSNSPDTSQLINLLRHYRPEESGTLLEKPLFAATKPPYAISAGCQGSKKASLRGLKLKEFVNNGRSAAGVNWPVNIGIEECAEAMSLWNISGTIAFLLCLAETVICMTRKYIEKEVSLKATIFICSEHFCFWLFITVTAMFYAHFVTEVDSPYEGLNCFPRASAMTVVQTHQFGQKHPS